MNYLFDDIEFQPNNRYATKVENDVAPTIFAVRRSAKPVSVLGFPQLSKLKPTKDYILHVMSFGDLNLTSVAIWIQQSFGHLEELHICAWSYGARDLLALQRIHGYKLVDHISIIASCVSVKRHPAEYEMIQGMLASRTLDSYKTAEVHAKVVIAKTKDGDCIVATSTANCTPNPHAEVTTVTMDEGLYNYYLDIFKNLKSKAETNESEEED